MLDDLDRLVESFGVPVRFRAWLQDPGNTKPDDFGIVTAAETSVDASRPVVLTSQNLRRRWP